MTKVLKLGIVGAGFIAKFHARAIKQIRNIEIAGIVSKSLKSAEDFSQLVKSYQIGDGTVYESIAEMAKHVDAIAIYSPNFTRLDIMESIADAVRQGADLKGVICEKPLGRNLAEARRIVQLASQAKLKTAYFENQIFMKSVRAQLEQLAPQQETMGPLMLVRSAEEHCGPHEPWFWDPTKQGGGVLSDMGCHSIAVGWYCLTPAGKAPTFLQPIAISADISLLKWGQPEWRKKLKATMGVDYAKMPAEDFATGIVTFKNPETEQLVKAQFTDSWMYEKQGLRLWMDGMGPGYAFEINTLKSSLELFVGDAAADAVVDPESALEKATSSRGLLAVQYNEADLYGYIDENQDMADSFLAGRDARLSFSYGLEITKLVMAAYMSAEQKRTIDLRDENLLRELETFVPLIQQGRGKEVLNRI